MSGPLYLLDTNIVSYMLTGRSPETRRRYMELGGPVACALSTITEAEIRYGCERRPQAIRLRQEVDRLLASASILPWDSAAAQAYARLRTHVQTMGKSMEATDLLIAAHALALNAILVTRDRDFAGAAGLVRIENWATDV